MCLRKIANIFSLLCLFILYSPQVSATTLINNTLTPLDSNTTWSTFFQTNNGQSADTVHFGAYVFHAVGETLYIGIANYRPADAGSALLASFNGTSTTFLGNLAEEGVNDIVSRNGTVIVGGVDPHDSWALGNIYTYNGTFSKIRDGNGLTNVIHMWGLDVTSDGTLYSAVSSHDGSFPGTCVNGVTCFGEVFKSTNGGLTWTSQGRLGAYRVFDVHHAFSKLYALYVDEVTGDNRLAVSDTDGASWTTLKNDGGLRRTHMVEFNDQLVVLGGGTSRDVLYGVNSNNTITSYNLPFSVGILYGDATYFSNYNQLVVADDDYMYVIASDGDIWRSRDLSNWNQVSDSAYEFVSLGYWPHTNQLLVSTRGNSAQIYTIDLDSNFGAYISGLVTSLRAVDVDTNLSATTASPLFTSAQRTIRVSNSQAQVIADVTTDLSEVRSWDAVQAESSRDAGRSFVSGLNSAPGTNSSYTLYIPYVPRSTGSSMRICPQAQSISRVDKNCSGGVTFSANETKSVNGNTITVTQVQFNSLDYWKAVGVTSGGGIDTSSRAPENISNSGSPSSPEVRSDQGALINRGNVDIIAHSNTMPFDLNVQYISTPLKTPLKIHGFWQVSDTFELWYTSSFNDARVIRPLKKSTMTFSIPQVHPLSPYKKTTYTLMHSQDKKKWKQLKNVVFDKRNRTLSVADYLGGYYIIAGKTL